MKKPILKLYDKIILLILGSSAILYSCYKYGMPVDEFLVKGVVTDSSNKPIQNIRIIKQGGVYAESDDTLYTNSQGKYVFKFWGPNHVKFKVEDIDGEENGGEFLPTEINVKFTGADLVKKGRGNKTGDKFSRTENIILYRTDEGPGIAYGPLEVSFKP